MRLENLGDVTKRPRRCNFSARESESTAMQPRLNPPSPIGIRWTAEFLVAIVLALIVQQPVPACARETSASSAQHGFSAAGGNDGDRFSTEAAHVWKGSAGAESWWWQCRWDQPRDVGAILQIAGDDPLVLQNAP